MMNVVSYTYQKDMRRYLLTDLKVELLNRNFSVRHSKNTLHFN